jgi:hypothetical protein
MDSYYIILSLFVVAAYFIITDESVASAFFYVTKLVKAYIDRQWWWIVHNPRNPVVKYIIYRRSLKMAEELMAKINSEKGQG